MKDIDFRMIQLLYETKNISKTAERMYLTQPALTKRLVNLEKEFGVTLVVRNNKGIEFTKQGEYVASRFTMIHDFLEETKHHLKELSCIKKDKVVLGVPGSYARTQFPKLLKAYHEQIDHLEFHMVSALSDVMFRQFCNGEMDIAIVCGDFPYYGGKLKILEEELNVITDHTVTLDELTHIPVIEYPRHAIAQKPVVDWWKAEYGTSLPVRFKVSNIEVALEMVSNGLGCTFLFGDSRMGDHPNTMKQVVYNQNGIAIKRDVWLLYSEEAYRKKYVKEFIDFVKENFQI